MTVLSALYMFIGQFTYFSYGRDLEGKPLITSTWSNGTWFGIALKIIFIVNLLFTYPLVIYPVFQVAEGYLFHSFDKGLKRMWLKNVFRTLVVAFTIVVALILNSKLDKFLALLGGFACAPIAFTLPCLFHYKLCAKTNLEKTVDLTFVIIGCVI